jgi:hypothetical protein
MTEALYHMELGFTSLFSAYSTHTGTLFFISPFYSQLMNHFDTRVLDPMPKLLDFHMSDLATCPYTSNKEAWKRAEKGDLLHSSGHTMGRGRVSTQPSSGYKHEL